MHERAHVKGGAALLPPVGCLGPTLPFPGDQPGFAGDPRPLHPERPVLASRAVPADRDFGLPEETRKVRHAVQPEFRWQSRIGPFRRRPEWCCDVRVGRGRR